MNRHLCRGKRLDNGEIVTGYYNECEGKAFIVGKLVEANEEYDALEWWQPVDPATVEPVKVKPTTKSREWLHGGIEYHCPSCDIKFYGIYLREGKVCGVRPFCSNCGQALDWSEGSAE